MSNRERWILYPLLVLALGASLRTQLFPAFGNMRVRDFESGTIRCSNLEVAESILIRGEDKKAKVLISDASNRSGQIHILGEDGKSVVALGANKATGAGAIDVYNAEGQVRVKVTSLEDGGAIATFTGKDKPLVFVEHNGEGSGSIVRYDADGHRFGMLGLRLPDPPPPAEETTDPAATQDGTATEAETTPESPEQPAEGSGQPATEAPAEPATTEE